MSQQRQSRWRFPLGLLSLGLGALQLAKPQALQRVSGLEETATTRNVLAVVGARELLHGVGLLSGRRTAGWAWTRVVGDAADLAVLGIACSRRHGTERRRLAATTGVVAAITAIDVLAAIRAQRSAKAQRRSIELHATTTVRKPRSEVYAFWRQLENMPCFMGHVDEVVEFEDGSSRWSATAPFGRTVSWNAELTRDVPGTRIEWRSVGRAVVPNSGVVTFSTAPDGMSTEVHVRLRYHIPTGRIGEAVARYFGEEPHQQIDDDLRRFKQVMETGEVMRSEGAPWGKSARHEFPQRPAQPPRPEELVEVFA